MAETVEVTVHDTQGFLMDYPGVYPHGTVFTLDAETGEVLSVTPPPTPDSTTALTGTDPAPVEGTPPANPPVAATQS